MPKRPVGDAIDDHVNGARGQHGGQEDEGEHGDELPAVHGGDHPQHGEIGEGDEEPEHEDVAVGEVDEADDSVDHRVAESDQGEDGAASHSVDRLLDQDLVPRHANGIWGGAGWTGAGGGASAAPPPDPPTTLIRSRAPTRLKGTREDAPGESGANAPPPVSVAVLILGSRGPANPTTRGCFRTGTCTPPACRPSSP